VSENFSVTQTVERRPNTHTHSIGYQER